MKKISLFLFLILSFQMLVAGQVNKDNPLGGSTRSYPITDGGLDYIEIEVRPLVDSKSDIKVDDLRQRIQLQVLTVSQTVNNALTEIPLAGRSALRIDDPNRPDYIIFRLPITNSNSISATNPWNLPRNWERFSYKVSTDVTGSEKFTSILYTDRRPDPIGIQTLELNLSEPIWTKNNRNVVIVPISSGNTSLGVKVKVVSDSDNTDIIAEKETLLDKNQIPNRVMLNSERFATDTKYKIIVEPLVVQGLRFNLKGLASCAAPTDISSSSCVWRSNPKNDYEINPFQPKDFKELTEITSSQNIVKVITMSDTIKTLEAKLNGDPINLSGNVTNQRTITINPANLRPGANTLSFEGMSAANVLLSGTKSFTINKNTSPELESVPKFYIENNSLKLKYKLKGDIESSKPELAYIRADGSASGTAGTFPENCNASKECSFTIRVSLDQLEDEMKKQKTIPVRLIVKAKENGAALNKEIWSADFDILNQAAVKIILDDIRTELKSNRIDETRAKARISREVLSGVNVDDPSVKDTYEKYVSSGNDANRKKWWNALIKVGNFALTGYGIPLKIPEFQ